MIVVDTNVIAYLFLGGEKTSQARAAFQRDPVWAAPILWRSEFRSVLALQMRQGRLTLPDALELIQEAETLLEGGEYHIDSSRILNLVSSSKCSSYDCEFVALAQELNLSLVTSDRLILGEFPHVALSLDDFSSK